ncbi:hypothetical protein L4D06_01195 [Enterovibrio makurazakiensis]|uniref:hypothetical protein n=1 Tax=Enterovibrio makurazakiensis TaxID=2910232 RepID=UPI003D24EDEB
MKKNNDRIDAVILWVDHQDEKWKSDLIKHSVNNIEISNMESRFRCWKSLHFIFRAFEYFIPWVNKVHFVTYGHVPDWLDVNHPKVNVVKHEDFIPNEHLPVFNSNAIEVSLNRIEGLADQFILFNDDTFVLSELSKERFFVDRKPVDFIHQCVERKGFLYSNLKKKNLLSTTAINNNIRIINELFDIGDLDERLYLSEVYSSRVRLKNLALKKIYNRFTWLKLNHVPQPHLKGTFEYLWGCKYSELTRTSSHRFRTTDDTTQYLFRYANLASGNFSPSSLNDTLSIDINSSAEMERMIQNLDAINLLSITDTESLKGDDFDKASIILQQYLSGILPDKSTFEL